MNSQPISSHKVAIMARVGSGTPWRVGMIPNSFWQIHRPHRCCVRPRMCLPDKGSTKKPTSWTPAAEPTPEGLKATARRSGWASSMCCRLHEKTEWDDCLKDHYGHTHEP